MIAETPTAPHDIHVERQVVGASISYEAARAFLLDERGIAAGDFHDAACATLWTVLRALHAAGQPVDEGTIVDAARRHPDVQVDDAAVRQAVWQVLADLGVGVPDVDHHATILLDLAERRRLLSACWATIADVQQGQQPAHELLAAAEQRLQQTGPSDRGTDVFNAADAIVDAAAEWDHATEIHGLSTGFPDLDRLLLGMRGGELIVLGARPSMGKSALAVDIARDVAIRQGRRALVISMEMMSPEIAGRVAAAETSIPHDRLTLGRADSSDYRRVLELTNSAQARNLMWVDRADLSVDDIASIARRVSRQPGGLDLLVVDYLQLIRASNLRDPNRNNQVSAMSRALKVLAQQLGVPLIVLSQLSRGVESRPNKRPLPSDLRDSGSIEQDANIVLLLYREDYYSSDAPPGIAELQVAKHRRGRTGDVRLLLEGSYPRFAPAPQHTSAPPRSLAPGVPYPNIPLPEVRA